MGFGFPSATFAVILVTPRVLLENITARAGDFEHLGFGFSSATNM